MPQAECATYRMSRSRRVTLVEEQDPIRDSHVLGSTPLVRACRTCMACPRHFSKGYTFFQSFFMSTTVQPRYPASWSALSSAPTGEAFIVGPFAHGVGVVDQGPEARPVADGGPFQHLLVPVGVAEGGNGPPADVHLDAHGLARLVIDEVGLRKPHEHRLAVAEIELGLDAAAHDLLGWNAIDRLRPRMHESSL